VRRRSGGRRGRARLARIRRLVALTAAIVLPPLAWVLVRAGELVGYLYLRSWPTRHLPYFDHRYDFLRGPSNWYWQERGIQGVKLIPTQGKVLDLCCGEGTYSGLYYSTRAAHVDAVDRNPMALELARRRYRLANVSWIDADVLSDPFPSSDYDVVTLFAAIEHFSVANGSALLRKIARSLKPTGALIGSTPIYAEEGGHNEEHDNEFFSIEYLREFMQPHFGQVETWTSNWQGRVEAYFHCTSPAASGDTVPDDLVARLEKRRTQEQMALTRDRQPAGVR
jgi:ubiquinone/menaquinone biosynthesis C-methylase UbiE